MTFPSGIRIITNGKFKRKIFGFIGNGTSSLDGYEQHKFLFMLFMYYLRRIFYAKNKFQEVIFTIIMVFVMVYAMICYNIVLNTGTMTNETFLLAFHELVFMGPIAFILDFFIIGALAKKVAFGIVDMRRDNPFHLVLAISAVSVAFMCPCMSFAATVLIKHAPVSQIIPTWLQTTAMNFPMAFFWQIFYAGPFVRFVFGKLFPEKEKAAASAE